MVFEADVLSRVACLVNDLFNFQMSWELTPFLPKFVSCLAKINPYALDVGKKGGILMFQKSHSRYSPLGTAAKGLNSLATEYLCPADTSIKTYFSQNYILKKKGFKEKHKK